MDVEVVAAAVVAVRLLCGEAPLQRVATGVVAKRRAVTAAGVVAAASG